MLRNHFSHITLYSVLIIIILLIVITSCSDTKIKDTSVIISPVKLDKYGFVADSFNVVPGKVGKNKTLSDILLAHDIGFPLITKIFNKSKPIFDFRKIRPDNNYAIYFQNDSSQSLKAFVYEKNKIEYVKVCLEDTLSINLIRREVTLKEKSFSGSINSSLYQTFENKNVSPILAGKLAEVFAWQIDFYTITKGDSFNVIYKEEFVENEHVGFGDILGAEFIHKGNLYNAILFEQDGKKEYFDDNGNSLQKEFLKAPLRYTRISSGYTYKRLHPILRVYKPHRGIDFAAPIGTPVQAVGDGIVIKKGREGAAGRMVKIRHNSVYTSGYMHLSKYGKGIKPGVRVYQGQVIGYVGSSGRSTGPHLDFRFWKNGSLVNYLTQKFPSSKSISEKNKIQFNKNKEVILKKLKSI